MKINIKSFIYSSIIIFSVPMFLIFTAFVLFGFGGELIKLFESIHPSGGYSLIENIESGPFILFVGIIINTLYAVIDSFIFSYALSSLYNFFNEKDEKV